eukprot:971083-Rhodomonas_salina.4
MKAASVKSLRPDSVILVPASMSTLAMRSRLLDEHRQSVTGSALEHVRQSDAVSDQGVPVQAHGRRHDGDRDSILVAARVLDGEVELVLHTSNRPLHHLYDKRTSLLFPGTYRLECFSESARGRILHHHHAGRRRVCACEPGEGNHGSRHQRNVCGDRDTDSIHGARKWSALSNAVLNRNELGYHDLQRVCVTLLGVAVRHHGHAGRIVFDPVIQVVGQGAGGEDSHEVTLQHLAGDSNAGSAAGGRALVAGSLDAAHAHANLRRALAAARVLDLEAEHDQRASQHLVVDNKRELVRVRVPGRSCHARGPSGLEIISICFHERQLHGLRRHASEVRDGDDGGLGDVNVGPEGHGDRVVVAW